MNLYKYLPSQYAKAYLSGHILFRNLTAFRQMLHEVRGDVREGCHVDSPLNDTTISTKDRVIKGPFSMRNSINSDKIFIHCLSQSYNPKHYNLFGYDAHIQIQDSKAFLYRCKRAIKRLLFVDPAGMLAGPVEYYDLHKAATKRDITDAHNIPFFKPRDYENQDEFRIAFARKGGLKITTRIIVDRDWNTAPDHLIGRPKDLILEIGDISDIASVSYANSIAS